MAELHLGAALRTVGVPARGWDDMRVGGRARPSNRVCVSVSVGRQWASPRAGRAARV